MHDDFVQTFWRPWLRALDRATWRRLARFHKRHRVLQSDIVFSLSSFFMIFNVFSLLVPTFLSVCGPHIKRIFISGLSFLSVLFRPTTLM